MTPRTNPSLFVVGTDTGVGKTVASAVLLRAARRGMDAHYWKPVQTGDEDDTSMVSALSGTSPSHHPAFEFPLPASPHEAAAAAGKQVDVAALSQALASHRSTSELLIAEPAGGLYVPLVDSFTQLDWITEERVPVVLIARSGLGTLNHSLLSLAALAQRKISVRGLILCGEPHPSNYATLERMSGVTPVVQLPLLAPLDSSTIDRWIDENEPALAEILRT